MVRNEYKSDVGQVVNGNASNTNPQAIATGNVVTLNLAAHAVPGETTKTINSFQHNGIRAKVRSIMRAQGKNSSNDRLQIYRKLFAEFSIEKTEQLPANKYHQAMAMLENLLEQSKQKPEPIKARPELRSVPRHVTTDINPPIANCLQCVSKDQRILSNRRVNRVLLALVLVLSAGLAWALLQSPAVVPTAIATPQAEMCMYNGEPHSVGSKIKMADSQLHLCSLNARWELITVVKWAFWEKWKNYPI